MHSEPPPAAVPPAFRMLVAEDSPDDRLLLQRAFEKAGVQAAIQFVENGQEVIEQLSGEPPVSPVLLLLDLKMPCKDGFEVLEWLRLQPDLSQVLVIVLSSSNLPGDMARARALGARHYLVKPSGFAELVRLARNLEALWRTLALCRPGDAAPRTAG